VPVVSYPTHSFFGIKNNFLGEKILLVREVPSFSQQRVHAEKIVFPTASYSTKRYPLPQKETDGIMAQQFSTYPIQLSPTAQGALDHDSSLQQNSKKNFKVDEVRALLDQGI
jgi:hypothetical protein